MNSFKNDLISLLFSSILLMVFVFKWISVCYNVSIEIIRTVKERKVLPFGILYSIV